MENEQNNPSSSSTKARRDRIRPCLNCRHRHLKCNYDTEICRRCQKDDISCRRIQRKSKFRRFAVDEQIAFSQDQTWISIAQKLQYVDETEATTSTNRHLGDRVNETLASVTDDGILEDNNLLANDTIQSLNSSSMGQTLSSDSSQHRNPTPQSSDHPAEFDSHLMNSTFARDNMLCADYASSPSQGRGLFKAIQDHDQIAVMAKDSPGANMSDRGTDDSSSAIDRAILLRFFVQELAPGFDICDPERHFGQSVPQRARSSPILLNAICTASARHIVRLQRYRNADGIVEWNGLPLPHINHDTALEYHNKCIRDLLRFSMDPEQVRNVNLLAASIILRSDEERYVSILDGNVNRDVFLQVTGVFIDAQTPSTAALPHTLPSAHLAPVLSDVGALATSNDLSPESHIEAYPGAQTTSSTAGQRVMPTLSLSSDLLSEGLRQACFWIALRQELYASLMAQRPFNFQLSKFDSFRIHSRAPDAVWADRIVVFHAAVLEYCYSADPPLGSDSRARWTELRQESDKLEALLPSSFQPIFHREHPSNPTHDDFFPEIWYLENWHAVAAAYFELTRMLLVSSDPRRPRFGDGYRASQRNVTTVSMSICRQLCGMALSNRQAPPVHLIACAAVALCADYFDEERQRRALLWFLDATERDIGYPTKGLVAKLTQAWADT